jgi:AmmeMemoRadiSam system protein B
MKRKFFILTGAALILAASFFVFYMRSPAIVKEPVNILSSKKHYALYHKKEFYSGLENPIEVNVEKEKVFGGIVSHHFFMEKDIAQFFLSLKNQNPETIVIIGPNHFNTGASDVLVSEYAYETPWGDLLPDSKVIAQLHAKKLVRTDEYPFEKEHAISALVGFIKKVFPDVKIVPILLKRSVSEKKVQGLADELHRILPENSLVIASVDFSHHQNRIAAAFHDEKSIATIGSFDFDSIKRLEVDSPSSIYALLRYLDARGAGVMNYTSKNAAEVAGNLSLEDVTSYVFAQFKKGSVVGKPAVSLLEFGGIKSDNHTRELLVEEKDPFEFIAGVEGNFFRGMDMLVASLEGPLDGRSVCDRYGFDSTLTTLLKVRGVNMLNIANSGVSMCGETGVVNTKEQLEQFGIAYFGDRQMGKNSYRIQKVGNKTVAHIGINIVSQTPEDEVQLLELVKDMSIEHDTVVVNVYWGEEKTLISKEQQVSMAHALIDRGVDMIIGYKEDAVEPVEIYKNKPIFYSVGNFVSQSVGTESYTRIAVGAVVHDDIMSMYIFPFSRVNGYPRLHSYDEAEKFCNGYLEGIPTTDVCTFTLNKK